MSSRTLIIPDKLAAPAVDFLLRMRSYARNKTEERVIATLLDQLGHKPQLPRLDAESKMTSHMVAPLLGLVEAMKGQPLQPHTVRTLRKGMEVLYGYEKAVTNVMGRENENLHGMKKDGRSKAISRIMKELAPVPHARLLEIVKQHDRQKPAPEAPSNERHARLAQQCVETALEFVEDVRQEQSLDMAMGALTDMMSHLNLAHAIWAGHARGILEAARMDTMPRERLPEEVWEMVGELREQEHQATSARKPRRP